MIRNKFLALFLGLGLMVSFTACEDYFGDINVNPNDPTDVTPEVLLPAVQVRLAFTHGGDISRFTSVLVQHAQGVTRQWASINNYSTFVPNNFNTVWRTNIYAGVLQDLNVMKSKTVEEGSNHYTAVANILLAYTWLTCTDLWDDMPYEEAFMGTDNLQPAFNTQEFIYGEVFELIKEAKNLLAGEPGDRLPGGEDLIYGGDTDQWLKLAHAVAARAHLHLGLVDGSEYQTALDELVGGFTGNGDGAYVVFGSAATAAAPWYQFNRDRGDIVVNPTLIGMMTALGDPRTDLYGGDFTDANSHEVLVADRAYPLITYPEMKFLEAEALLETNGDAAAIHAAYREGIFASMTPYGFDDTAITDYIDSIDPGQGNVTLEDVMMQKYIALFLEPEVYNDWRRTGIPELTPNSGNQIPVRFPYAEFEILFNNNTPTVNVYDNPVWWDR